MPIVGPVRPERDALLRVIAISLAVGVAALAIWIVAFLFLFVR